MDYSPYAAVAVAAAVYFAVAVAVAIAVAVTVTVAVAVAVVVAVIGILLVPLGYGSTRPSFLPVIGLAIVSILLFHWNEH